MGAYMASLPFPTTVKACHDIKSELAGASEEGSSVPITPS